MSLRVPWGPTPSAFAALPWLACAAAAEPFEWVRAAPESQGMSSARLDAARDALAARKTKAFLVIRNDRVVYEWYATGHSAARKHYTASMAKAIAGGVALAVALSDGRIALDDRAAGYIREWKDDPLKSRITIRQLGSHASGLADAHEDGVPHERLSGWRGEFWKRLDPPRDPFTVSRDAAPVLFEPGQGTQYSNPGIALLTYAVTAALKGTPHQDIRTLLRERVLRPIGVRDDEWSVGYGQTCEVDGLPLVAAWGGGSFTARAVARIGRLMLREGDWDGARLLSREVVRQTTSDAGTPGNCGMGWWSNNEGTYARLPRDAFWGSGAGHQIVLVVPSLGLIAVRNGEALAETAAEPSRYHEPVRRFLFEPLLDALTGEAPLRRGAAPCPPSPVIERLDWAPRESIVRRAGGSDRFPITWADDGAQYTAWGDGNGFGKTDRKLSLGFARLSGPPDDFLAEDIRSPTGEDLGDGRRGLKACGLVSILGTLYLWAGNADRDGRQSRLAWSSDRARTWTWADWSFEEFGYVSLVNFGKDYAGARDGFVYGVAHDHPSAYVAADRFILLRAPKEGLKERAAYEFLARTGPDGRPEWTRTAGERGAVFAHPGACLRQQMTYCAPLRRYLWWQQLPARSGPGDRGDTRFEGGFGIYDSPEPWGPWTTVFHTEDWDVGPGETASFPARWMSADGRTLHLVFSGDDSFSVRKTTFTLAGAR